MSEPGIRTDLRTMLPLPTQLGAAERTSGRPADGGGDFAEVLRRQLESVSRMQTEADEGLRKLLTGESDDITQVFSTAKKAQVAFNLLLEIRNKLVESYAELKDLRV